MVSQKKNKVCCEIRLERILSSQKAIRTPSQHAEPVQIIGLMVVRQYKRRNS